MRTLESLLAESAFFRHLAPQHIGAIAGCAWQAQFKAGDFIFREGEESSQFYVLRAGKVALEISVPGQGPMIIQTLQEGDVLSWSWVVWPYKKYFDAHVVELTRAIAFDGECVRKKCDADPQLGYELLKLFATVVGQRLHATRLQLLDLYADHA
jgi:CRP-like cAMP-binding protein